MNAVDVDLGDELQSFKSFTEDFPADLKGEMIGNSDMLRTVHNSFSNPNNFISERLSERFKGGESEDLFHFVAFMPINGHLYELDGLKSSPHKIEPCTDDDWIDRALDGIQNRINSYGGGEVRFSLMAVCADRVMALQAQVDQIKEGLMEFYDPTTKSNVSRQDMSAMDIRLDALQEEILNEEAKQNKWKKENALRRHNFIPLFMQLLAEASRSGRLGPMVKKACAKK
ncbi:hypothetical protein DSO57_1014682 [Entomophthora muscae]|nr:hypothetical protein DSO57_1014682 [Entomophthora muscae]